MVVLKKYLQTSRKGSQFVNKSPQGKPKAGPTVLVQITRFCALAWSTWHWSRCRRNTVPDSDGRYVCGSKRAYVAASGACSKDTRISEVSHTRIYSDVSYGYDACSFCNTLDKDDDSRRSGCSRNSSMSRTTSGPWSTA